MSPPVPGSVSPGSVGVVASFGPELTTIVTVAPRDAPVPASFILMTLPFGTVSLFSGTVV